MKSYSETDVFSPLAQAVHKLVSGLMSLLPDPEPRQPPWRCHEVARAVLTLLEEPLQAGGSGASLHVFDGKYGPPSKGGVEHSWLILLEPNKSGVVLDPYAVGRLPQVQLIDWELQLACMYQASSYRTDINKDVVQHMVEHWRKALADEQEQFCSIVRWLRAEDVPVPT